jgi:hypothetical protein
MTILSKMSDYDMNSDESDGDCNLEVTMSFDDVSVDISGSLPGIR